MKFKLNCLLLILLLFSCDQPESPSADNIINRELTKEKPLDQKADMLADSVMAAMGGQKKWDELHYVSWTFFGARNLVWDKWAGRVRIESPKDSSIYVLNINTMEGRAMQKGIEITEPESLVKSLERAKSIWINDSYWLVMPFKLKDPGVNLRYLRQDTTINEEIADVLELTFEDVGDTPNNKYEIYIDQKDHLVKQWAFFKDRDQESPPRVWPWDNYKDFNGLLLSGDRSDNGGPSNIKVYEELPDSVFESLEDY